MRLKESLVKKVANSNISDIDSGINTTIEKSIIPSEQELTFSVYGIHPEKEIDIYKDDVVCDLNKYNLINKFENLICRVEWTDEQKKEQLQDTECEEYYGVDIKADKVIARLLSDNTVEILVSYHLPEGIDEDMINNELMYDEHTDHQKKLIAKACGYYRNFESMVNKVRSGSIKDLDSIVDVNIVNKSLRLYYFLKKHHVKENEYPKSENGKDSIDTIYSYNIFKSLPKEIIEDLKKIPLRNLNHLIRIFVYKYQNTSDYQNNIDCFDLKVDDVKELIWVDLGYDENGEDLEALTFNEFPELTQKFIFNTIINSSESMVSKTSSSNISDIDIEQTASIDKESLLIQYIKEKGEYEKEDEWTMCRQCKDIPLPSELIPFIDKNHIGNKDQLQSIDCIFYYTDEHKLIIECTSDYYENRVEQFYFESLPSEIQDFVFHSFMDASESMVGKIKNNKMTDSDINRELGIGYDIGDLYPKNEKPYAIVVSLSPFIIMNIDSHCIDWDDAQTWKPEGHEDEQWYLPTAEEWQKIGKQLLYSPTFSNYFNDENDIQHVVLKGWSWTNNLVGRKFANVYYLRDLAFLDSFTPERKGRKTEKYYIYKFRHIQSLDESLVSKISNQRIDDNDIDKILNIDEQLKDFVLSHDNNGDTSEGYNQFYNFTQDFTLNIENEERIFQRISICLKPFYWKENGNLLAREKGSMFLHRWDEEDELSVDNMSNHNKMLLLEFLKKDKSEVNESMVGRIKKTTSDELNGRFGTEPKTFAERIEDFFLNSPKTYKGYMDSKILPFPSPMIWENKGIVGLNFDSYKNEFQIRWIDNPKNIEFSSVHPNTIISDYCKPINLYSEDLLKAIYLHLLELEESIIK